MTTFVAPNDPDILPTDIIRIPASGPRPANVLAYLRCRASGEDIDSNGLSSFRFTRQFKTEFVIKGFVPAQYQWYLDNVQVSATAMLRIFSTTTDLSFTVAIDEVEPSLDYDGRLGFRCAFGVAASGIDWFEKTAEMDITCDVSAYVLLHEPVESLPPSGKFRPKWAVRAGQLDVSDLLSGRTGAHGTDGGAEVRPIFSGLPARYLRLRSSGKRRAPERD